MRLKFIIALLLVGGAAFRTGQALEKTDDTGVYTLV